MKFGVLQYAHALIIKGVGLVGQPANPKSPPVQEVDFGIFFLYNGIIFKLGS